MSRLGWGLVLGLLSVSASASEIASEVGEFPRPDLGSAEASVRQEIGASWRRLDALAADSAADPVAKEAEKADALGALGRLYHAYLFERAAAETYALAEALDPASPVWPYLRAAIHQRNRELEAAEAALRRVLELEPELPPARLRLAEVLRLAGKDGEAEAVYEALLSSPEARGHSGAAATALFGLGRLLASRGESEAAAETLAAALELAPEANAIHQQLGLVERRRGRIEEARRHLSQAGPVEPTFADPWAGDLLPSGATARLLMGNRALRRGQLDQALAHHRAAYEADPENPAVLRALALSLEKQGLEKQAPQAERLRAEAVELYGRARGLAPDDPLLHYDFARAVLGSADGAPEGEALEALGRAVELAPTYTEAHLLLAGRRLEAGELDGAIVGFERVLELSPGQGSASEGLALALYGRAVASIGSAESAVDLGRALELAEEGSETWIGSALALVRVRALAADPAVREPRRAVELASRAFELAPSPEGAEVMALALASAGGFEQAIAWQSRLLDQARAAGAPADYLRRLEGNLARYRSGESADRPW